MECVEVLIIVIVGGWRETCIVIQDLVSLSVTSLGLPSCSVRVSGS